MDAGELSEFLKRYRARYDPEWPATPEEYREWVAVWASAFDRHGVTVAEADLASLALAESPPQFRREHVPAVVAAVKAARAATGHDPGSVEAVRRACRACPHCDGQGIATVYHPRPDPARAVPASTAAHCVCAAGRLIRSLQARSRDGSRWPDLADVLAGRSVWRAERPAKAAPGADDK